MCDGSITNQQVCTGFFCKFSSDTELLFVNCLNIKKTREGDKRILENSFFVIEKIHFCPKEKKKNNVMQ